MTICKICGREDVVQLVRVYTTDSEFTDDFYCKEHRACKTIILQDTNVYKEDEVLKNEGSTNI
jgi:hypothetical protein